MSKRHWTLSALFLLFATAGSLHGQAVPVGGVVRMRAPVFDPPGDYYHFQPTVAASPEGGWMVFWPSFFAEFGGASFRSRLVGRPLSRAGVAGDLVTIDESSSIDGPEGPVSSYRDGTGWWLGWTGLLSEGSLAKSAHVEPAGTVSQTRLHGDDTPQLFAAACPIVLPLDDGGRLVAWSALSRELQSSWIEVQAYDATGAELGPRHRLGEEPATDRFSGFWRCPKGIVQANGIRSIAWTTEDGRRIGVTEFLASGALSLESLGNRAIEGRIFVLTQRTRGRRFYSLVGIAPGSNPPLLRRFEVDEKGVGRITAEARLPSGPGQSVIDLVADGNGNLVVLWQSATTAEASTTVGLWNQDLVPQGTPFKLPARDVAAGFGGDGDLLAAWARPEFTPIESGHRVQLVRGQRFRVSRDDDACFFRRNLFSCDTGGNGGVFEARLQLNVGLVAGDQPLLGDVNGDGRQDPCVLRGSNPNVTPRLLCDPEHDGGPGLAYFLPFGFGTGTRLAFGHLDGDGREDYCTLGPLWSCVRTDGSFRPGVLFGRSHWQPLLADFDGDGRDNFCEYFGGRFACDLGNDGGPPDLTLSLPASSLPGAGAVGLAGDIDGDGRDEACAWAAGRLVCGHFAPTGGAAARLTRRALGAAGDTPLLGDLDNF